MKRNDQTERVTAPEEIPGSEANSLTMDSDSRPARFEPASSHGEAASVQLHIEELVLDGFEPVHRYAIGEAIQNELARLLNQQGAEMGARERVEIKVLDAGAINPYSHPSATGRELARAIYRGLIE